MKTAIFILLFFAWLVILSPAVLWHVAVYAGAVHGDWRISALLLAAFVLAQGCWMSLLKEGDE